MRVIRLAASAVDPRRYLDGANLAFGHWGDETTFRWAFRNDAELLFVEDADGRTIAASGINWRTLRAGRRAAIITGSWTHAEARGLGAFGSLLEATRIAALEQNALLLGFGRMENPSRRRFEAIGAHLHPTFYCRSTGAPHVMTTLDNVEPDPDLFPSVFQYTPAEWRVQYLQRPHAQIECVGHRGGWAAVIEQTAEFDRVHALSHAEALPLLAARAHAGGRRLFWFATRPPAIECEWTDGFLSSLPPVVSEWEVQNGDRM
jgi:hypothetical protein